MKAGHRPEARAEAPQRSLVERFPALRSLAEARQRQVPFVRQFDGFECGLACLAMVLGYFGRNVALDELREMFGGGRAGLGAATLLEAAERYGLRSRAVRIEVEELSYLRPASILHWEFTHFVVFERVRGDAVLIVDPGFGRRRVSLNEFRRCFTGIVLTFEPNERFARRKPSAPNMARLWRTLSGNGDWTRVVVLSFALQLFALAVPVLTGALVDRVLPRADEHLLLVLSLGLACLVAFTFLTSLVRAQLLVALRIQLDLELTLGFLEHLIHLPLSFFQVRSAGDLMLRLNSNQVIRDRLTTSALSGLLNAPLACFYLLLLLVFSPLIAAVAGALAVAELLLFLLTRERTQELLGQSLATQTKSSAYQLELLTGMETLKGMGAEQRAVERWSNLFIDTLNVWRDNLRLTAWVDSARATLRLAGPLSILTLGAHEVLTGDLSLGTMLGLNALAAGFLVPFGELVTTVSELQLLRGYVERLNDVFQTAPEQATDSPKLRPQLRGEIELQNVSFRYSAVEPCVLEDINLKVRRGQFIAIVGHSGSGKSTLANLLLGLYRPSQGRVLYDGLDLKELDLTFVRRQFGIVSQRATLFGTSIRNNIALGDPSLSLERVVAAARLAQIHDEISRLGMGYDTPLSEGGSSLSGGQRQRLAIARALVHEPAILLLDEATSALDAVLEGRVHDALTGLACTRLSIAHRLSTIVDADVILVLDRGRIVERGTHRELLEQHGLYSQLVNSQLVAGRPMA
jgi:ATP-binding cassette subfamily B protein